MNSKHILYVSLITAGLLLIPLCAMQFTQEVAWTAFDFIAAGVLLWVTGIAYAFLAGRTGNTIYKGAAALTAGTALFLIWANLAVGIIGNENNPANLLYFAVIAILLIQTVFAGIQPEKMARSLWITTLAQMIVPFIAIIIWKPVPDAGMVGVIGVNTFFATLWACAALLFHKAGSKEKKP